MTEPVFGNRVTEVVALPDSILAPALKRARNEYTYVAVAHEAQAVAIAAGLTLAGRSPLVCMESSGLRAACESMARLGGLHNLHVVMLISDRGAFGDPNWWAKDHSRHMFALLEMLQVRFVQVYEGAQVVDAITRAYGVLTTRTSSAAVVCSSAAIGELVSCER